MVYGFIAPEDGSKDVFVHISAVEQAGLHTLNDGQKVSYDVETGRQGKTLAENLHAVRHHSLIGGVVTADADLLDLTAEIVAAHAARSPVCIDQLPELIRSVHRTLAGLASGQASVLAEPEQPGPAVPIQHSVTPDYVVCLDCGMRAVVLKRHLARQHGLTPEAYRARWGLPRYHPLVAPRYTDQLAAVAQRHGLGLVRPVAEEPTTPER